MPNWLDNAIFYEIYPQSFQDSNGDGIGDLQGIIQRLDYIQQLGCNAIWLNPCFDSPFADAGYDVKNYCRIAPRYGTNQDMKQLLEQVHRRKMRLILDLVPGHTSVEHPWFLESMKPEKNEYTHRYLWTDSIWEDFNGVENTTGCLRGISARNGSCAVNFFSTQPALNYGFANPDPEKPWQKSSDSPEAQATLNAMIQVMDFWLKMGCDGFRVDMAGSLVKNDPGQEATIRLWQKVRAFLDENYPDAAMISEWGNPGRALRGGFHMDFLLHFGPSRYWELFRSDSPYFSRKGTGEIGTFLSRYEEFIRECGGQGLICLPSGNHDMERISYFLDEEECKLAFLFLLTMPGAPFIYYGDEIGMRYQEGLPSKEGGYHRTGSRTPMQWDNGVNAGFSTASPEELYLPIDPNPFRPTVQSQQVAPGSLYHTVQKLINLRLAHPALQSNAPVEFLAGRVEPYPLVYRRKNEEEDIIVILNPSNHSVEYTLPWMEEEVQVLYQLGGVCTWKERVVNVDRETGLLLLYRPARPVEE